MSNMQVLFYSNNWEDSKIDNEYHQSKDYLGDNDNMHYQKN